MKAFMTNKQRKQQIEKMIKQASTGADDKEPYGKIMDRWIKLTQDINWCEVMSGK